MPGAVSAQLPAKALSLALDGFVAALGADRVLTAEAALREYRDPFAYKTWDDYTASAVVLPRTRRSRPAGTSSCSPAPTSAGAASSATRSTMASPTRRTERTWSPSAAWRSCRRAHLDFMDLAADQYSFNGHAYRRFNETIKDALDPSGILSPGKQGIWPKGMREARSGE